MRVIFMGTPEFAAASLRAVVHAGHEVAAVVTRPDRPRRSRSARPEPSAVKRAAEALDLPVMQPESIRGEESLRRIADLRPQTIVVVAFGALLPPALLEIPPGWCINVHASLLPRYRGAAPIARSIMAGESVTGITTMKMDQGLDTGDILLQSECAIGEEETCGALTGRLAALGATLLVETLAQLDGPSITPRPQDHRVATNAPPLRKEEGRIDWNADAVSIAALVRACNPWPAACAGLRGATVQLLRAGVVDATTEAIENVAPGTIVAFREGRALVRCAGERLLAVDEMRFPGRRAIPAAAAANGRLIRTGDSFVAAPAG